MMPQNTFTTHRNLFLMIFLLLVQYQVISQPKYNIESFQGSYNGLSSYESIALLTQGSIFWEYEFDLNFDFPFFDSVYNKLIYREEAWGSFTENQDEALLLMDFLNGYGFDPVVDTSNITSDVRFAHVSQSGIMAFVIQYTNVRFIEDPYALVHNSYLNFQIWLYEDGLIEVHFGDIQMDDNPIYLPGFGFWCYDDEGIDTSGRCGPHMGIADPEDEEIIAVGLNGAYNDFEVIEDNYGTLTVIPPQGWIIRFSPTMVSTNDPQNFKQLIFSPNPATDFIKMPFSSAEVLITDDTGSTISNFVVQDSVLDIASFPPGMYYLQTTIDGVMYSGKFVKL